MSRPRLVDRLTGGRLWRSVVRHGPPDTPRNRVLVIISNVFLHLHPAGIRPAALRFRHTWCMGGISFFLFLLLTMTGILIMFYYRPTVEHAYADMKDLQYAVAYGVFLRNLHRWTAHGMVLTVILHMARVFYAGAYRPPREFNWVVGVALLVLTFLLSFTGYLLPWDQLAFWAITVGTNMAGHTPFLGAEGPFALVGPDSDIRFLLLGGREVGQGALLRFYVFHCVLLPVLVGFLLAVHFWRVRKDGGTALPL